MTNITSRLAISLQHLPDWQFNWSDMQPQRRRESLTFSDFLPTEDDAEELKFRAIHYIMHFLVHKFKELQGLKEFLPQQTTLHPIKKTEVVRCHCIYN